MLQDIRFFDVKEDQVKWVQEGVEGVQEGVEWVQEEVEWRKSQRNMSIQFWSLEGTNQFNDAMTEENFICCSIKGEQMVYIDWPGGPTADPLDDRRLRTCLPIKGATRYKIFWC